MALENNLSCFIDNLHRNSEHIFYSVPEKVQNGVILYFSDEDYLRFSYFFTNNCIGSAVRGSLPLARIVGSIDRLLEDV